MTAKYSRLVMTMLGIALLPLLFASEPAYAQDHWQQGEHSTSGDGHNSQAWAKQRIEKEASILEIKPSQQAAWEEYAAVKLEFASAFAKGAHNIQDIESLDASVLLRQRADHLTEAAKNLSRLADATEKLQAVLSPEQRTVLKRLVAQHGFHHHFRHAHGYERGVIKHDSASISSGKQQTQKSK